MGFLKRVSQLFCRHSVVRVIRYHKNCVPTEWRGRLLYVDRLEVHNFVQCTCCERVLYVDQRERLFEDSTSEAVLAVTRTPSADRVRAIARTTLPLDEPVHEASDWHLQEFAKTLLAVSQRAQKSALQVEVKADTAAVQNAAEPA